MELGSATSFNRCSHAPESWVIQNPSHIANPDLGLQEGEAARLALKELEKLKGTKAHRLSLVPTVQSFQQIRSLFYNLDKYIFRKVLQDNVSLRFSSLLPQTIHGSTSALGVLGNQIVISLNSNLLQHPSRLALVASLLHQMAHAYLLVCCGFGDGNALTERHDLKHGLAFSSIVHTIQDLLVDDARIPLPDLFYCSDMPNRSIHPSNCASSQKSLHSYCHSNSSDHKDKVACGAYMRHVIATARARCLDPSPRGPSPANSAQSIGPSGALVHSPSGQSLHRAQPTTYPLLQFPITFAAGTAGSMPNSGDYQALMNLQTFLASGDYDPKIASRLDRSSIFGPPRIHVNDKHKTKESSPTSPLHDLRTYVLALRASIEPLRRLALLRLYSQQLLKKEINAVHFLEEIYTGVPSEDRGPGEKVRDYKPDNDLRRFVQAFLCAKHPDLPSTSPGVIQLEYEHTVFGRRMTSEKDVQPRTKDNTNLHILQTTDRYRDRLSKLRGKGGLFLEDLDEAKSALDSKEPIRAPDNLISTAVEGGALPVLGAANANVSNGMPRSIPALGRLEPAHAQRNEYGMGPQRLRRPQLGLRTASGTAAVDDLFGERGVDDLERLSGLRL